ncbi:hypothetical protein LDO26_15675 [Luteimonas sp. BDR2-5]|uniref:hypothetical protein n=1 Tax=Proluteimonas luteida TaxID=2878685 RepID=UPI001E2B75A1|nr:hypothetical protein [Luteimonas sp. BDR2-5]MCD9029633.1 hypothetical protein [Luteimonas sp. BDR2-5]
MLDGDGQQNGALERLYELIHDGMADTVEFEQLDRMVYAQLLETYGDADAEAR